MIRIGIVGCGRILNAHLQGYKKLREHGVHDFRITALAARKPEDALMFARRGEGPTPRAATTPPGSGDPLGAPHTYLSDFQDDVDVGVYTDYHELVASGDVDAVNDLTTLSLHHQVGEATLRAGKHLLSQKPLAVSVKAARRMVDLAAGAGLTLATSENVCYSPSSRSMIWAIARGLIGRPQIVVVGSLGGLWSPDSIVADTPWRHRKLTAGGGGSVDIGVHFFNLLRHAIGEVSAVTAVTRTFEPVRYRRDRSGREVDRVEADVDDSLFAVAEFESGAVAQMLWSWACRGDALEIPGSPVIYGSEGCIKGGELISSKGARTDLNEAFRSGMSPEEREAWFPFGLEDSFAVIQYDWLRALSEGVPMMTAGDDGLRDLACAFASLESSEAARRVEVSEVLDGTACAYQKEIDEHFGL